MGIIGKIKKLLKPKECRIMDMNVFSLRNAVRFIDEEEGYIFGELSPSPKIGGVVIFQWNPVFQADINLRRLTRQVT
ncbi:MAG: hypothetical protein ACOH2A_15645 [Sphingobacteriaceae bacterium]